MCGPGPYCYGAVLEYSLDAHGMTIRLAATNLAAIPLPFGLGFHPWFPRTRTTQLMAAANSVWLEDARHLPTERAAMARRPEWDFSSFRSAADRLEASTTASSVGTVARAIRLGRPCVSA